MTTEAPSDIVSYLERGWSPEQIAAMQAGGAIEHPVEEAPAPQATEAILEADARPTLILAASITAVMLSAFAVVVLAGPVDDPTALATESAVPEAAWIVAPVASSTHVANQACGDAWCAAIDLVPPRHAGDVTWRIEAGPGDVVAQINRAAATVSLAGTCDGTSYAVSLMQAGLIVDQVAIWVQAAC